MKGENTMTLAFLTMKDDDNQEGSYVGGVFCPKPPENGTPEERWPFEDILIHANCRLQAVQECEKAWNVLHTNEDKDTRYFAFSVLAQELEFLRGWDRALMEKREDLFDPNKEVENG